RYLARNASAWIFSWGAGCPSNDDGELVIMLIPSAG
ncbi:hypothetical protein ABIA85_009131, partial [Bradyrhizobium sp. LA6.10]